MKKWYHSKALLLGVLVIAFGIAEYLAGMPAGVSVPTIVAGCLGVVIRFLTRQGLVK